MKKVSLLLAVLVGCSLFSCTNGSSGSNPKVGALLTTITVTLSTDNNPGGVGDVGDLRYAINSMNQNLSTLADDYVIVFATPMTIQLNGNLPIINNSSNPVNIIIGNPGSVQTVTIDGNGAYSGFFIPIGNVTIRNMIFQNLTAKGGDGGNGISGGGGGLGAGGAIFAPQTFLNGSNPAITLQNVSISNCSAVGGNGGSYFSLTATGNEGGGGGGGFGGNGGSVTITGVTGGAGGGGYGGNGGDVILDASSGGGGGGGGGIGSCATIGVITNLGHGGSDQSAGQDGNGYGLTITAGSGGGGNSGGNNAGGGGGGSSVTQPGGGGGGSSGSNGLLPQGSIPAKIIVRPFSSLHPFAATVSSGGNGGDGAGGGGGGAVTVSVSNQIDGGAGNGGYGGGGGGGAGVGAYDTDYVLKGGSGGLGGGGGGGGVNQSGVTAATGGDSLGGGGGAGGGPSNGPTAQGGADVGSLGGGAGGIGANSYGFGFGGGGGGGGSALGGAIFVDSNLNFTIQALSGVPTTFNTPNNTTQAGTRGTGGPGASDGQDGSALGNSIFLRAGSSLTFRANDPGDVLTLGDQVAFVDDTVFGAGGTQVYVRGDGTVIYQGTTDYQGDVRIRDANFKVTGQIDQASIYVAQGATKGTLSGSGTLTGNVLALANGVISPDAGSTLTLGSLNLNSGSTLHTEINVSGTSTAAVTGAATLNGKLEIKLNAGAVPGTYVVLTSSGLTGTFSSVTFSGTTPSSYSVSYLPAGSPTYVQFQYANAANPRATGTGTLAGSGGPVNFSLSATRNSSNQITASMYLNDPGAGVRFDNPVVTSLNFTGNQVTFGGTVRVLGANPQTTTFTVTATDNTSPTPDTLSVTLGTGYTISGNLTGGDISNQ